MLIRYFLTFSLIGFLFALVITPFSNRIPYPDPTAGITDQGPQRINYIGRVKNTVETLNHSPHIMTIHHNKQDKSHAVKREVTVKFKKHPTKDELAQICKDLDAKVKRNWDPYHIFKSSTKSTEELIDYFEEKTYMVEFAEPNYLLLPNEMPNDPLYTRYQWNLPLIHADEAWRITPGKEDIVIAVIDTGVDLEHQDFQDKLVTGYNVISDNNYADDDNGHGTHVAGIISAKTNNTVGIAGVSWHNKIMPIKAMTPEGTGSSFDIAKGIKWAADHGAHVINMSVGNYHPSAMLQEAVRYAYNKGVVLVAASGNDNTDQSSYPAAYPEVISVAAVDSRAQRANFSNYGSYVEVAAPGVDIPSTYLNNEYAALSGTSMACPHVAGLAGLILSTNPDLGVEDVRKIIQQTSEDLGTKGWDPQYGHGMINVAQALELATNQQSDLDPPATVEEPPTTVKWGDRFFLRLRFGSFQERFGFLNQENTRKKQP
ncbi:S8 family peptidase [Ammoniphilus sp. CFH 90114]|uniref:S8 family peptidase n=1 Tax=Ammoniphilus sp. CFH 90114 TaxID=2493665 RepID=UPI00100E4E56|nr:S8 family peptidase [Ammoniphilus sp. CFH 90114]RXT13608.1 peptidase S8 [Ammoniphilus sp. CFH 90114]